MAVLTINADYMNDALVPSVLRKYSLFAAGLMPLHTYSTIHSVLQVQLLVTQNVHSFYNLFSLYPSVSHGNHIHGASEARNETYIAIVERCVVRRRFQQRDTVFICQFFHNMGGEVICAYMTILSISDRIPHVSTYLSPFLAILFVDDLLSVTVNRLILDCNSRI
jgi:hypothetical protein